MKELDGKGLPARAVYTMLKSLAEKHAKTSKNFWELAQRAIERRACPQHGPSAAA